MLLKAMKKLSLAKYKAIQKQDGIRKILLK